MIKYWLLSCLFVPLFPFYAFARTTKVFGHWENGGSEGDCPPSWKNKYSNSICVIWWISFANSLLIIIIHYQAPFFICLFVCLFCFDVFARAIKIFGHWREKNRVSENSFSNSICIIWCIPFARQRRVLALAWTRGCLRGIRSLWSWKNNAFLKLN